MTFNQMLGLPARWYGQDYRPHLQGTVAGQPEGEEPSGPTLLRLHAGQGSCGVRWWPATATMAVPCRAHWHGPNRYFREISMSMFTRWLYRPLSAARNVHQRRRKSAPLKSVSAVPAPTASATTPLPAAGPAPVSAPPAAVEPRTIDSWEGLAKSANMAETDLALMGPTGVTCWPTRLPMPRVVSTIL
jgi:hypothetical protein